MMGGKFPGEISRGNITQEEDFPGEVLHGENLSEFICGIFFIYPTFFLTAQFYMWRRSRDIFSGEGIVRGGL